MNSILRFFWPPALRLLLSPTPASKPPATISFSPLKRSSLLVACFIVLLFAGCSSARNSSTHTPSAPQRASLLDTSGEHSPHTIAETEADLALTESPLTTFRVDATRLFPALSLVHGDEHSDQLLDWATLALLVHRRVGATVLRDAFFDLPALRRAELDDVAAYAHGPGRFLVLDDDTIAIVYAVNDERPRVTVARMADQARQLLGAPPRTFEIWRYASDVVAGRLTLERLADRSASDVFGPEFGYVERTVDSVDSLQAFIDAIDDLSLIERVDNGAVRLGGRRFASARTRGVSLDDVAALMNAQASIARRWGTILDGQAHERELVTTANRLVRIANASIVQGVATSTEEFDRGVARLKALLGDADSTLSHHDTAAAQAAVVRALQPRVVAAQQRLLRDASTAVAQMRADPIPQEPGFSLDPTWRKADLLADLDRLLHDPQGLLQEAHAAANAWHGPDPLREGGPAVMHAARTLQQSIPLRAAQLLNALVTPWAQRIASARTSIAGAGAADIDPLVYQLRRDVVAGAVGGAQRTQLSAAVVEALFDYVIQRNRVQCARYDGPLEGTRAAMTLYYTDLVAKLWAGLDYRHQAPRDAVTGFWPLPPIADRYRALNPGNVGPERTRIWFGPRVDRVSPSSREGLLFAPLATKIFAAGADPATRGQDGVPGEPIHRVLSWWDNNFLRVADHEPEYHRLNQLTKWSLATAWMAREGLLPALARTPFQHDQRFDGWLHDNSARLRYAQGVDVLPPERSVGHTECIDILSSYNSNSGTVQGGVNTGGRTTLATLTAPASAPSPTARRAAMVSVDGHPDTVEVTPRYVRATLVTASEQTRDTHATAHLQLYGSDRIAAARASGRATQLDFAADVSPEQTKAEWRTGAGRSLSLTARTKSDGGLEMAFQTSDQSPPPPARGPPLTAAAFVSARTAAQFTALFQRAVAPSTNATEFEASVRQIPDARSQLVAAGIAYATRDDATRAFACFRDAFAAGPPPDPALRAAIPILEALGEVHAARLARAHLQPPMSAAAGPRTWTLAFEGARPLLERRMEPVSNARVLAPDAAFTAVNAARFGGHTDIYADQSTAAAIFDAAPAPTDRLAEAIRSGAVEVYDTGMQDPEGVHADALRDGDRRYWHVYSDDSGDLTVDRSRPRGVLVVRARR